MHVPPEANGGAESIAYAIPGVFIRADSKKTEPRCAYPFGLPRGDTPGGLYGCERKGVGEKGICKSMKTKGEQISIATEGRECV